MKLSTFINRPVLSTVISIFIVLLGLLGLMALPIEQYPNIAPPTISVSTNYTGANAQAVLNSVIAPLEEQINGAENMDYMYSTAANNGSAQIQVYFKAGTDPDMAAVDVQNRVAKAASFLPSEVNQVGVITQKRQSSMLMVFNVFADSGNYSEEFVENYAAINIIPVIKRVPGVGEAMVMGADYSMRIWLKPEAMAQYGLMPGDITAALAEQNIEAAPGQFGENGDQSFQYVMRYKGRLTDEKEFGDIIIRATPEGEILRLSDVADVELGRLSYGFHSTTNGKIGVAAMIMQAPGSNATQVVNDIQAELDKFQKDAPEGIKIITTMDVNQFLSASIHEVIKTLIEAFLLVFLVVFIFLQDFRSTLIPMIAIPVALIGTFFLMYIFGFSLNLLTLSALVLAIAIVVDDAIVVVENVDRIMNAEKIPAAEATAKAMKNLGSALIAMSLVLCAVFVPVSFLPGITGQLYRQFTVTIAVSVVISTVVALTLSPVMCAKLLRPSHGRKAKIFRRINLWLWRGNRFYGRAIARTLSHPKRMYAAFGLALVFIYVMNALMPRSFMSQDDQGYFSVELEQPEGATIERTREVTERAMAYLLADPDVEYVLNVTGSSPRVGSNQAHSQLTVILKPWGERKSDDIAEVRARVHDALAEYPECKVYVFTPSIIPGLGSSGGFEMVLEARADASYADLQHAVDTLRHYASKSRAIADLSTSMQADIPQLYFDVDRDRAKMLGIPVSDIFSTMKAFTGSIYVNDFNMFNRIYRVYIQADAPYRARRENIDLFFVKSADGTMVPVSSLGTSSYTTGPGTIGRFNMFSSATVSGEAGRGYSTGEAMDALEEIVREHLPPNIGVEWSGLSYQQKHESGNMGLVLGLVFLFVFLFLAALYESWSVPLAVILSLPIAGVGAYLGIWICGLENNIYFQIGLVMLVGLVAKNAILIVEFAKEETDRGVDAVRAALKAARLRFRPIVMTSLAFMLGLVPLVIASGPGSGARRDIGTGVFFGMGVAITVGIVFVPFFFVAVNRLFGRRRPQLQKALPADDTATTGAAPK